MGSESGEIERGRKMSEGKYGPYSAEVGALLEKVGDLPLEQLNELGEAFDAAWSAKRRTTWGVARRAAKSAERDEVWEAVRHEAWEAVQSAPSSSIRDAVWGAAIVLAVQDLINEEDFNVLYAPWASVVEVSNGQIRAEYGSSQ